MALQGEMLYSEETVLAKIDELAARITLDYSGKDLVAIGILNGSFMFFSDLVRRIRLDMAVDFIVAKSYVRDASTGKVRFLYEPDLELAGKDVLLVEDIIDTGITIMQIKERLLSRGPESVRVCALLDKESRRLVPVEIDYKGFSVPDLFLVGYGLDYDGRYRTAPYISALR